MEIQVMHPRYLAPALLALALAACGKGAEAPLQAADFDRDTSCALDGMLLADYPGPKAQIVFEGAKPEFFCDTVEMFSIYLKPEQQRRVRALFVQDMGKADWNAPRGNWIDAKSAFYVHGSKKRGAMGPTLASFAQEDAAKAFASQHGGKVLRFAEVKPDMVVLDGGALHDQRM
jgi:copper chaperone NosL